jgi:hypothetical protein
LLLLLPGVSIAGYFPMYHTWPQPGGLGSPITLTYSYSNLFDGSIKDSSTGAPMVESVMRSAFETAFWDYAIHLPIHFVEVPDNDGPLPESTLPYDYDPTGLADIRIGQVPHIDGANAYAYFPFSTESGLAGDIVFNAGRFGYDWSTTLFYAVAQHELGHSLGMGHYTDGEPEGGISANSEYSGPLFPLEPLAVEALQAAY